MFLPEGNRNSPFLHYELSGPWIHHGLNGLNLLIHKKHSRSAISLMERSKINFDVWNLQKKSVSWWGCCCIMENIRFFGSWNKQCASCVSLWESILWKRYFSNHYILAQFNPVVFTIKCSTYVCKNCVCVRGYIWLSQIGRRKYCSRYVNTVLKIRESPC